MSRMKAIPYVVLVVDSDPASRLRLGANLLAEGWKYLAAQTVADGLALCVRKRPHIVVLDIQLPDGSWLDARRYLKADTRLRGIPILVLGNAAPETEVDALNLGADDYVAKPFHSTEVVARIRRLLAAARPPEFGRRRTR